MRLCCYDLRLSYCRATCNMNFSSGDKGCGICSRAVSQLGMKKESRRIGVLPGLTEITWSLLTGALGSTTVWGSMARGRMPDLQERIALDKPSKIVKNS